ncbi:S-adenosyl-dependent methyltransferase activity on membrane-located substrates [Candidatus Zixiibacteriota bacterium]|nr:S-adenosyl-dependent methyltransferase activity on membrane-located substrates [candidate division Zixibacteria bacterium]
MIQRTGRANERYHHRPVLAEEAVRQLVTRRDGVYLDLTCGGGGHLKKISEVLSAGGQLIGVDRDPDAIAATLDYLKSIPQTLRVVQNNFGRLDEVLKAFGISQVSGVLLDLGISSFQIDTPERGFSFMQDGPLDMRMDNTGEVTAATVVNEYPVEELLSIFRSYGEEKRSYRAARAIAGAREKSRIETTGQLRQVLEPVFPPHLLNGSLARIFQALRIVVNGELEQLETALPKAVDSLETGGHLVVISYHSLEDRIVKRFIADRVKGCICPPEFPVCVCGKKPTLRALTRHPVKPSEEEIKSNSRAKSARLRAAEKMA